MRAVQARPFLASDSGIESDRVFSGIIDNVGTVLAVSQTPGGREVVIHAPGYWTDVADGASVAIDGVCLTVTTSDADDASFDVIAESLRRSTLGGLRGGDRVNLQKSMCVGDPVDGHFVQGHVDAVATVVGVEQSRQESLWWFEPGDDAMRYVVPKGSVAIDGISLTVAEVEARRFSVALIPTTLARTTLGDKRVGARVNVETDILVRAIVHRLDAVQSARPESGMTRSFLSEHGFDPH